LSDRELLRRLEALYSEMHAFARSRDAGQTPRLLEAHLLLLAQGLAQGTQRVTGYPYRAPHGLSPAGGRLDAFLRPLGHTIDHTDSTRRYAYSTDLVPWFPGKAAGGGHDLKPTAAEIEACWSWFEREVEIAEPRAVVLLGREAASSFLRRYVTGERRVRQSSLEGLAGSLYPATLAGHKTPAIVVWHPSSAWGRYSAAAARTYAAGQEALRPIVIAGAP